MKKSLLFVAILSFFLIGLFAFAKDNDNEKDHSPARWSGLQLFTWNNKTEDRQESHTGNQQRTGVQFTGLSSGAIVCVTLAITTRDASIKSWMIVYNNAWLSAFTTRTTAFIAALSLTSQKEIQKAIDLAWKVNEKSMKAAQKTKRNATQAAWTTYRTNLKACNTTLARGFMLEKWGNDLDD